MTSIQITQTLARPYCLETPSDLGWGIFFGAIIGIVLTIAVLNNYYKDKQA
jgi:hypothetical protein